MTARIIGKTKC